MATERVRQQRTPTEFGPDVTSLSGPNLGAASFTTPGVRDQASSVMGHAIGQAAQTAAQGAGFALNFASDVHTGLALADLEQQHEDNIQSFIDSQPENQKNLAIGASTLNDASNALWSKIGDGASIEDLDTVEKHYQDQIGRLQRANKQGVMSADEFAMNTLAITRQAINKNPHLFDELTDHARKVLGMSGVDQFAKAQQNDQEAQQKVYQQRVAYNAQLLKEFNVPVRYDPQGNYDLAYGEAMAAKIQEERFAADVMNRNSNIRTEMEKQQAAHFINNYGVQGVNGVINSANQAIIQMLQQPGNKTDQTTAIRQIYQNIIQHFNDQAGPVMHMDGVKDVLSYAQNTVNAMQKTFESFNNKEDQMKFLSNSANIMRDQDYIRYAKISSPAAMENLTKIIQAAGPEFLRQNPALWAKTQQTLVNLLSNVNNGVGTDYNATGMNGKSVIMNGLDYIMGQDDPTSAVGMNNMFKSIWADSQNVSGPLADEATKFKFYDQFINTLASANASKGLNKKIDPEALAKVSQNFEDYMNMSLGNLSRDMAKVQGLKTSILPNGMFQMTGTNPNDTKELMMKYTVRINNGITALSNLMGISQRQAADQLIQQFPQLSRFAPQEEGTKPISTKGNKPNESNPLNLTIPGKTGQFQSFNSVEEGLQAASNQLDRYFTGKTTGKPLTTMDQIVGLWNNENEKGSSSKADYMKTVARYSGLDPNTPLDLTDPNVKADLMYGMSKAEGRNLRPSQILMAINK